MLTFLHGADFHLDSPFRALPPEQAAQRRQEQRDLWEKLAELVVQEKVELVLLPGDLLDRNRVYPETVEALREILGQMPAKIFIAPGNHDPYTLRSTYARLTWPENVHIFSTADPQRVEVPELDCAVYGGAFLTPYRLNSPLEGLELSGEGLQIGCFHGELDSNGRYGPLTREEIGASKLDYLALGHIHAASGLKRAGQTYYAYPGCALGRGFDETGEKGVYLGRMDKGRVELTFTPLKSRQYRVLSVDITGRTPAAAMKEAVQGLPEEDIVRIVLTGLGDRVDPPRLDELAKWAREKFFWAVLADETNLEPRVWNRRKEDTLTGLFLRNMSLRIENAPEEEKAVLEKAVRFGLAALEGREEPR